jgi:hypothetical protein
MDYPLPSKRDHNKETLRVPYKNKPKRLSHKYVNNIYMQDWWAREGRKSQAKGLLEPTPHILPRPGEGFPDLLSTLSYKPTLILNHFAQT